jgi:hypothetical protein
VSGTTMTGKKRKTAAKTRRAKRIQPNKKNKLKTAKSTDQKCFNKLASNSNHRRRNLIGST